LRPSRSHEIAGDAFNFDTHCCAADDVSVVSGDDARFDGEDPRRLDLLALSSVRRGVESAAAEGTAGTAVGVMFPSPSRDQVLGELRELIRALDARVPHVERAGELSIARAAAQLRDEAVQRIQELEGEAGRERAASRRSGADR
jgi:hypothetical protein